MRVGFIGLGNVGAKLAGSVQRNGHALTVLDLSADAMRPFAERGARAAESPADLARDAEVVITCLPSPSAVAAVMEGDAGVISALAPGAIWAEMSTTDAAEVRRLGAIVEARGARAADTPVSRGCHRAATGNISIFAGCERPVFDALMPVLKHLGRRILHTGPLGSASELKVMTNYLATANLLTLCEAMVTMERMGHDPGMTFEAISASSGTSFVHETESQVILNGSRSVDFTLDLVLKDVGLFQTLAERAGVPLELSPEVVRIVRDGIARFGERAQSDRLIERLEAATGARVRADGFPAELVDAEPEVEGAEVRRA